MHRTPDGVCYCTWSSARTLALALVLAPDKSRTTATTQQQTKARDAAEMGQAKAAQFLGVWHQKAPLVPLGDAQIRAMDREAPRARPPDGNQGAWLLPFVMGATTAAVVASWSTRWACPSMGREAPIPNWQLTRKPGRAEISLFIGQNATRGPNATRGRDPPWRVTCGLDPPTHCHGCDIFLRCSMKKTVPY